MGEWDYQLEWGFELVRMSLSLIMSLSGFFSFGPTLNRSFKYSFSLIFGMSLSLNSIMC